MLYSPSHGDQPNKDHTNDPESLEKDLKDPLVVERRRHPNMERDADKTTEGGGQKTRSMKLMVGGKETKLKPLKMKKKERGRVKGWTKVILETQLFLRLKNS